MSVVFSSAKFPERRQKRVQVFRMKWTYLNHYFHVSSPGPFLLVSKPGNEEIVIQYRQENAQANGADGILRLVSFIAL